MSRNKLTRDERRALLSATLKAGERGRRIDYEAIPFWQKLLALFGIPAESNPYEMERLPVLTGVLIAITFFVSIQCFQNPELFSWLAFYPDHLARLGGLNLLTCFFVHGGWVHLLSNMYVFFIFGDNVEDVLGHFRFGLLLVAATAAGSIASATSGVGADIPHVGASGGISGVMIFYLLAFPRARFTYFVFFWFYRLPAVWVLFFYLFVQLSGAFQQLAGVGEVDYLAHIGGGLAGLVAWLLAGRPRDAEDPDLWA